MVTLTTLMILVAISMITSLVAIALTLYFIRSVKVAFKGIEDRIVLVQDTSEESALQISEFSEEMAADVALLRSKVGI